MIKSGTRFESQVCDTQVIVIRSTDRFDDLRCGGSPMVAVGEAKTAGATIDEHLRAGNALGKRYVDESGAEVLVTKPGDGTLTVGETPMQLKAAKALPASD
ncbi:hypothetical protein [Rhodococcus sp. NPDC003348]